MKAILFDLDNTLIVKSPTIPEKWRAALCDAGHCVSSDDTLRAFAECEMWVGRQIQLENETGVRMSDKDFLNGVMGCCTDTLGLEKKAGELLAPIWAGRYAKEYRLMPGAKETLERLKARGLRLGIVSNNNAAIRSTLEGLGIIRLFDAIVISEEVGLYKPDPRILLYACAELETAPEDALYVGDHPFDVVCANEAGVPSAWIPVSRYMRLPHNTRPPQYRLSSLDEIIGIV